MYTSGRSAPERRWAYRAIVLYSLYPYNPYGVENARTGETTLVRRKNHAAVSNTFVRESVKSES